MEKGEKNKNLGRSCSPKLKDEEEKKKQRNIVHGVCLLVDIQ